jgi:OOP family OmpA-OmpF porin
MPSLKVLIAFVLLPLFAAGCASSGSGGMSGDAKCAIVGAAAGAGTGILLDGEIIGALIGAGAGAVMGSVFCADHNLDADGDGVSDDMDKCPNTPAGAAVDKNGCPKDTDRDGVADYKDKCVTPAGVSVDATGCAIDSDGDGVSDAADQCPGTPAGTKVDAFGCAGDSDGDGVSDALDQCLNTPAGWAVDTTGCALPLVFRDVTFAFDSASLTNEARAVLDKKVAPALLNKLNMLMKIVGHTDSRGKEAYNLDLSLRRARSVASYLATKGVARGRLSTDGKGESDPVAPNTVEAGRAANRRVEMFVTK